MTTNKAFEEEHAKSEAMFESIGSGAIATDEHGRIYRINDTALELLEYDRAELEGTWFPKSVQEVNDRGEPTERIERPIARAFLTGKTIHENTFYKTKSGRIIPVDVTVSPILLDGKPIGAVQVFQDITLEYEIDKMKTEFISIASHQLRTPLSAINTYSNMMYDGFYGELNNSQKRHMQTILTAIDRMNGIISTLLDVSQFEAGKINVKPQSLDVGALLDSLVQDYDETVDHKNIRINKDYPEEAVYVTCDRLLLGEVYSNLISNALKYSKEGGEVSLAVANKQNEVVFSVEDNGYGIPEEVQKNIFTKFYRADNIQRVDTTGTGLGLYLVKQIADVIGGRIWFESKADKGSIFYFALPNS